MATQHGKTMSKYWVPVPKIDAPG